MNIVDLIAKKSDGKILTYEEIKYIIKSVTINTIADYQTSAMLMAMYIQGLTAKETADLTLCMSESGEILNLKNIDGIKVDKHSTGGVADTTTLILAPLVASLGVPVIKMSGRGLGFTGGTLDKLESISGFNINVSYDEVLRFGNSSKIVLMGQSENLTPADKKLYALRDVTATVDNISLIAASIMSKKIAAGADAIVLDVKCGSGAFMKDLPSSILLAEKMVEIGTHVGRKVIAVITSMTQPLGENIGNALEVIEAIETLKGNVKGDLLEVSIILGAHMLFLAGKVDNEAKGRELLLEQIENGKALAKFKEFLIQQGGNSKVIDNYDLFDKCQYSVDILAKNDGYFYKCNTEILGKASVILGAGRVQKSDNIDYGAGIIMQKRIGNKIEKGDIICRIFTNRKDMIEDAKILILQSIVISEKCVERENLILKIVK